MPRQTGTILRWLGGLLSLASIAFIVWRFGTTAAVERLVEQGLSDVLLMHVLIAVTIYVGALLLLALAWWWLMSAFALESPPLAEVIATYSSTQFAKYLPGNVGQYVARHAMLRRLNAPHGALLAAVGLETASLIVVALAWAAPVAGSYLDGLLHVRAWWLLCALLVLLAVGVGLLRLLVVHTRVGGWIPLRRPARLFGVMAAHVGFFGLMVWSLILVADAMPLAELSVWLLAGVATTSWLAGFVVIGSPGGLGVREAVFVALLHGAASEPTALLLAALFRVITFLGDFVFLLLGLLIFAWLRRRKL